MTAQRTMRHMRGGFITKPEFHRQLESAGILSRTRDPKYVEFVVSYLFLNHKTIELISDTSLYGFIYKLTLKDDVIAPYMKIDYTSDCKKITDAVCYVDVREYILKLTMVNDARKDQPYVGNGPIAGVGSVTAKAFSGQADFLSECAIQFEIYNRQFLNGHSLVPPIISPIPILVSSAKAVTNPLLQTCATISPTFAYAFTQATIKSANDFSVGITCMELMRGYVTVNSVLQNPHVSLAEKSKAIMLGRLAHLLLLSVDGKYVHLDPHIGNLMVNLNDASWLEGIRGKAIVIDFGRSRNEQTLLLQIKSVPLPTDADRIKSYLQLLVHESPDYPQYKWPTNRIVGIEGPEDMYAILVMLKQAWQNKQIQIEGFIKHDIPTYSRLLPVYDATKAITRSLVRAKEVAMNVEGGRVSRKTRKSLSKRRARKL